MKAWIPILFLIFVQEITFAQGVVYQEGTIDLTGAVDLKMVFDGGFRPTRTPGLENGCCQVENVKAKIIFPGNRLVNMLVERGTFHVDADEQLTSIDFYGPFQPLNDAIDQAEIICRVLSLGRGDLENIRANPGSWDHPNWDKPNLSGWGGDINIGEHRSQFVLRPEYHYKVNGADIIFQYQWLPSKLVKTRTTPIEPPKGYENFSMKAPKWHPTGPAFPPFSHEQVQAYVKIMAYNIVALGVAIGLIVVAGLWNLLRPGRRVQAMIKMTAYAIAVLSLLFGLILIVGFWNLFPPHK